MNTWTTLVRNLPKNVIITGGNMHTPVLPGGGNFCRITYWVLIGDITPCHCRLQLSTSSGGFRGDRAGSSLPLDDGLTPSRYAVVLASANFWSNYCKTCTLEYSEWLPPVAFSQLNSAPNSFPAAASPRTQLGELTVLPDTPIIIIILQRLTRRVSVIRMTNRRGPYF